MSVKVEKLETNVVELEFEIDKDAFESAMQRSYIKNIKHFNIPGLPEGQSAPEDRGEDVRQRDFLRRCDQFRVPGRV